MRVTKNILEAEDNEDENGKLWFSEIHVPLYLVRDFEQKAGVSSSPSPGIIISNSFTNFYQRRVKATIGNIFFYLFHKGDVYPCSSCEKDVAFRCPLLHISVALIQLFFSCHCKKKKKIDLSWEAKVVVARAPRKRRLLACALGRPRPVPSRSPTWAARGCAAMGAA